MKRTTTGGRISARLVLALTACLGAVGVLTSAGAGASAAASSAHVTKHKLAPFQVLAVLPLSGAYASIGDFALQALQAGATVVNDSGGVLGHRMQIVYKDDTGTATTAVSLVQQALAGGTAYGELIPGCLTPEGLALAPLLASHQVLQMSTAATDALNAPSTYPDWYMAASGFAQYESALVAELKTKHLTRFAVVDAATSSGQAAAGALQRAAKAQGLAVTDTEYVPAGAASAIPQVQAAQASRPQALVIAANTPETGPILQARQNLGWQAPVYVDAAASAADLSSAVSSPAALSGVVEQTLPFLVKGNPATKTPVYEQFLKLIYKLSSDPPTSMYEATSSWDEVMVARAAAIKAKSVNPAAVAKAVTRLTYASDIPDWIGATQAYTSGSHEPVLASNAFIYVPAAPLVKGLVVEPSS